MSTKKVKEEKYDGKVCISQIQMNIQNQTKKKASKYKCLDLPETLPLKAKDSVSWFAYSSSDYFPICILLDDNETELRDDNVSITMKVEMLNSEYDVSKCQCKQAKGIYWFKALKVFGVGICRITFTPSDPRFQELVHEIKILETDPTKSQDGPNLKKARIEKSHAMELFLNKENSIIEITANQLEEFFSPVRAIPDIDCLAIKHRLEMSLPIINQDNSLTTSNHLLVRGPLFSVKISPMLLNYLYREQYHLNPIMNQFYQMNPPKVSNLSTSSSGRGRKSSSVTKMLELQAKSQQPTACEIFKTIQSNTNNTNIKQAIDYLLFLFEKLFVSHIIYPFEQSFYNQDFLEELHRARQLVSQQVGVYYFLRFLIVLITLSQIPEDNPSENKTETGENENKAVTSTSKAPMVITTSSTNGLVTNRIKGPLADVEKAIELSIKHLEENSLLYFY